MRPAVPRLGEVGAGLENRRMWVGGCQEGKFGFRAGMENETEKGDLGMGGGGRESRRAPWWYIKVAPEREIDLLWASAAKWGRPGRDMKES